MVHTYTAAVSVYKNRLKSYFPVAKVQTIICSRKYLCFLVLGPLDLGSETAVTLSDEVKCRQMHTVALDVQHFTQKAASELEADLCLAPKCWAVFSAQDC